jgi:hypothetical protein
LDDVVQDLVVAIGAPSRWVEEALQTKRLCRRSGNSSEKAGGSEALQVVAEELGWNHSSMLVCLVWLAFLGCMLSVGFLVCLRCSVPHTPVFELMSIVAQESKKNLLIFGDSAIVLTAAP